MLNAHCFLILHSMPQYSPCLFSECCFELTLTCFFVFKKKEEEKNLKQHFILLVKAGQYFSDTVNALCDFLSVITVLWPVWFSSRPVHTADVAVILCPIPLFSVQREDKGFVCTCAGEHLNKCIVFVQKKFTMGLSSFFKCIDIL